MQGTRILCSAALGAVLAACAPADGGRDPAAQRNARAAAVEQRYADHDRDGTITRQEAQADPALARNFDRYDTDGSGALERAEFARLEAHAAARRDERERSRTPAPYGKPR